MTRNGRGRGRGSARNIGHVLAGSGVETVLLASATLCHSPKSNDFPTN